jgi:hypothetical protein
LAAYVTTPPDDELALDAVLLLDEELALEDELALDEEFVLELDDAPVLDEEPVLDALLVLDEELALDVELACAELDDVPPVPESLALPHAAARREQAKTGPLKKRAELRLCMTARHYGQSVHQAMLSNVERAVLSLPGKAAPHRREARNCRVRAALLARRAAPIVGTCKKTVGVGHFCTGAVPFRPGARKYCVRVGPLRR